MHSSGHLLEHSRIGRSVIEARAPALINLPLPLPSVPVLTPLLSPLIAGSNQQEPGTTTSSSVPPAQTSTTSGNNNGNNNGNGGNGGGNGGGNSNNNGNGSSSGNGNSNSGGDGSSAGGTSGSNNTGGNAGNAGGGTNDGSNNTEGGGGGGSGGGGGGGGGDGNGDGSSTNNASTGGGNGGSDSNTGISDGTSSGGGSSGGTNPSSGSGGSPGSSKGASPTGSTGGLNGGGSNSSTPSESSSTSGAIGSAPSSLQSGVTPLTSSSTSNFSSGNRNSESNSGGAGSGIANVGSNPDISSDSPIAGGVTGTGTVGISGSAAATQTVLNGHSGSPASPSSSSTTGSTGGTKGGISSGAIAGISVLVFFVLVGLIVILLRRRSRSRRSERQQRWWFGGRRVSQTFGGSGSLTRLIIDFAEPIPPLPPMAETRGPALLISVDNSNFQPTNHASDENRFSVGSAGSGSSDQYAQYLVVQHNRDSTNAEVGTPMSVRPFSPSESFAFPKPPGQTASGDWSSYSRPQSTATLATNKSPGRSSRNLLDFHALPSSPINPFSDASANPFLDPTPAPTSTASDLPDVISTAEFSEVEIIRRPFVPTLHDELAVKAGDKVVIVHLFDDGWAMVNKLLPTTIHTKEQKAGYLQGLIPIDCLREAGQDLSTFLTAKRVSSYSDSNVSPGAAL